ncbi:MAG: diguanylate cyclase [Gammaproteobacteria bacterium]
MLQLVAERLRTAAGPRSLLARLGGDEFTVLIEDVKSQDEVAERANDIVAALQQPLSIKGRVLSTSASVGASLYPNMHQTRIRCCAQQTSHSFARKELGRNRYALYRPLALRRGSSALSPGTVSAPRGRSRRSHADVSAADCPA